MSEANTENAANSGDYWAIHAEHDGRPWLRGWATSEAEANEKLAGFQKEDPDAASTEYWVRRRPAGRSARS